MNYEEAKAYLKGLEAYGSVLGLDNMYRLTEALGNPQEKLRFIHIAGTNGKGSTMAFLSEILTCAGWRVGRYVSPTVFSYREKIQVNGENVSREDFAAAASAVRRACEALKAEGKPQPTVFEAETAMAIWHFAESGCDVAVLETGLGGLLDATNVIRRTAVAVFTSISYDHMSILGNTLEEIAGQKAGILKPGAQAVCSAQDEAVTAVLRQKAGEAGCPLTLVDRGRIGDVHYGLEEQSFTYTSAEGNVYRHCVIRQAGTYQIDNAALAVEAAEAAARAGFAVSKEAVMEGLRRAAWPGRFTVIHRRPPVILDGAHNRDGAVRLAESVQKYFYDRKKIFLMGVFADKEYEAIAAITAPLADKIYTIETPGNGRALGAEKLLETVRRFQPNVQAAGSIREAVGQSVKEADGETVIVAFGSLSHLGIVREEFARIFAEGEDGWTERR